MSGVQLLPPHGQTNQPLPPQTQQPAPTPNPPAPPTPTPPNPTAPNPPAPPAGSTTPVTSPPVVPTGFSNMQILYYKINLESTKTNMYGEALEKWYFPPAVVPCLIERGVTANIDDDFGVNLSQTITVKIPKDTLVNYNFLPEIGDIVVDRERFYEISDIDSDYINISGTSMSTSSSTNSSSGYYIIYVLTGFLTRTTKLNLIEYYQ